MSCGCVSNPAKHALLRMAERAVLDDVKWVRPSRVSKARLEELVSKGYAQQNPSNAALWTVTVAGARKIAEWDKLGLL
jgi:hypothetical protein